MPSHRRSVASSPSHRMRIFAASHPHSSNVLYMALLNGGGPHMSTAMSANSYTRQG